MAHPTPAERLLSMLEEEDAIAALPAEDINRELAAFALDPSVSVAFAKALARGDSPSRRLMGVLSADDADDEIARLESADIDEVRARVDRGTAAAVTAAARRSAGSPANVVGLAEKRRRRRRLIAWGGPLAGIAASLLVFAVMFGNAYLDKVGEPQGDIPGTPTESLSDAYVPPAAEPLQGAGERRARSAKPEASADVPSKENGLVEAGPMPPAAEKKIGPSANEAETLEKQERFTVAPEGPPLPLPAEPPTPAIPRAEAEGEMTQGTDDLDSVLNSLELDEEPAAEPPLPEPRPGLARSVEISELDEVLVVDPSQVPLLVQSQSRPESELRRRLEEARRLAGDRQVIALYRVRTGDRRRDYAQVPLQSGQTQQLSAPAPLIGLLGVEAGRYDFIPLSGTQPTK